MIIYQLKIIILWLSEVYLWLKKEKISLKRETAYRNMWNEHATTQVLNFSVKKAAIVTMCICAIALTVVSKNYIFAGIEEQEPIVETSYVDFETNDNAINYFFFEVQKDEEGEIILDFKRGNGNMFAKLVYINDDNSNDTSK